MYQKLSASRIHIDTVQFVQGQMMLVDNDGGQHETISFWGETSETGG